MKKFLLCLGAAGLLLTACENDSKNTSEEQEIDMSDFYVYTDEGVSTAAKGISSGDESKNCETMGVLNRQLNENPGLAKKMFDIEYHTRKFMAAEGNLNVASTGGDVSTAAAVDSDVDVLPAQDGLGTITIPVNVIIVNKDASIVTDAQVAAQIERLNSDFANEATEQLPSGTTFENDRSNTQIQFTLYNIERHNNNKKFWGTRDAVKTSYPPTSPTTIMNLWVCDISKSILGYAQFPGGNPATDGIVVTTGAFGPTSGNYNLGRTATHEVGHYLNLRHIWGDGGCTQDDFVLDTPPSDRSNGGCPSYPTVHCDTPDMTMNFMDYTYDRCMYMFTDGQRNRMRAIFASGGPRAAMVGN